jgi:DNA-binding transcriptional MerR regulator
MAVVEERLSIGAFSALTGLSPKALRLYHEQRLLAPASVDEQTGYRWYARQQVEVATRIALLRRAGIPLTGIAAFLRDPSIARIDAWRAQLEDEVRDRRAVLDHLAHLTPTMTTTGAPVPASTATILRAIPKLASLDLERTQRFWQEKLGFERLFTYPDYAISGRDGVQVHFWLTDDADIPKQTGCRIDVTGVDALHDEMQAAGVVHPNGPLTDQPWGFREFSVLDGDGNLVTFGELLA